MHARSGDTTGLGVSCATGACVTLTRDVLADAVVGSDAMEVGAAWEAMVRAVRNIGRPGVTSMAIAAVDTALWDLKARLLELPLVQVWGQSRSNAPMYGSGGFTSYSDDELTAQLSGWVHEQRNPRVKMKIGTA